jgi:predicted metal-dependent peptidase
MTSARAKIAQARTALVLEQPFFGALSLRLRLVEDATCDTAWVDGTSLGYNPQFIESLSHDETIALIAHEVMHCACGHPWRRDGRDHDNWNEAADYAINGVLQGSGFSLPGDALIPDPSQTGRSAEWIYDRIPPKPKSPQGGGGKNVNGLGEVRDSTTTPDGSQMTEEDWTIAVQQAERAAEMRGEGSPGAKRAIDQARSRVDWKSVLRRFMQQTTSDYSWTRPNVRYISQGLYLPALRSEDMGPVVVAIDTSGSIDSVLLSQFAAEVQATVDEAQPSCVHVLYCDAEIHRVDTFERGTPIVMNPSGGGGTDFRPVFDWIARLDADPAPVCAIYLTDLYGRFPETVPDIPVLWAATHDMLQPPFGETVLIN